MLVGSHLNHIFYPISTPPPPRHHSVLMLVVTSVPQHSNTDGQMDKH